MKKKLAHIWYYYKWYILAAALVIYVLADFVGDVKQVRPVDARVSIVSTNTVEESSVEALRLLFGQLYGDRNGDGYTEIEVNVYAYDGEGNTGGDADNYSAAGVHLASEIRTGETDLFLSDAGALMAQAERLECRGSWLDYGKLKTLGCEELEGFSVYVFPEKAEDVLALLR